MKKCNFTQECPIIMSFIVVEEIVPYFTESGQSSLTKFQQVLLTLMKLRLNLSFVDLSYGFGILNRMVSRIFYNVLNIMSNCFSRFVLWPSREDLHKTMPAKLLLKNEFGNKITIIIDCFKIFIEKPSNLTAHSQTWLSYKHHNTIKYLIGISPKG